MRKSPEEVSATIRALTRDKIIALMAEHGTQRKAALAIGIGRSTLANLVNRYGIKLEKCWPTTYGNAEWQALREP